MIRIFSSFRNADGNHGSMVESNLAIANEKWPLALHANGPF
jgi:hypothetical protein